MTVVFAPWINLLSIEMRNWTIGNTNLEDEGHISH